MIYILAILASIAATVLAFIYIVPEKKLSNMPSIFRFLHDTVNFKYLIIEKILQATYILATAFTVSCGFFMLFYVQKGYYGNHWYGLEGLLLMILGPIAIRISYEMLMMTILLIKNVIQINSKLKAEGGQKDDPFAAPSFPADAFRPTASPEAPAAPEAPVAPEAPAAPRTFCPSCGKEAAPENVFCEGCGNKLR